MDAAIKRTGNGYSDRNAPLSTSCQCVSVWQAGMRVEMALYKVKLIEGITFPIEDERELDTLAADLARSGHLLTNKPQIAARKVLGRSPIAVMGGNVLSIEPTTVDG